GGVLLMRRRRAVLAAGLGLGTAALGYRAWDRGVLTVAKGPAYTPWDEWRGSETEGSQRPLRAGILAASPHNTQPWLFGGSGHTIEVYADHPRNLGTFDPFRREMHLELGCAIENFVCAARVFGIATEVQPAPGRLELSPAPQPVLAASIALGTSQATPDVLFDAIPRRHTNRGPYRDEPPAPERLRKLVELVSGPDARVVFVSDGGARRELGAVVVRATEWIIADLDMLIDSFRSPRTGRREVLTSRDGVTIDAAGISRLMTIAAKLAPEAGPAPTDPIALGPGPQ